MAEKKIEMFFPDMAQECIKYIKKAKSAMDYGEGTIFFAATPYKAGLKAIKDQIENDLGAFDVKEFDNEKQIKFCVGDHLSDSVDLFVYTNTAVYFLFEKPRILPVFGFIKIGFMQPNGSDNRENICFDYKGNRVSSADLDKLNQFIQKNGLIRTRFG
ncbi:MAG: hypothetical protein FWC51_01710 [Proteobacteria bacterium]|nr:hypothetical protein [Pseudomonadota bacterium]